MMATALHVVEPDPDTEIARLKAECRRLREMLRAERKSHAKTAKCAKVLAWERDAGLWRRRT